MDQIKERCIYCGSNVYYTGTDTLIKCSMCGHTLIVAKFENELAKMNAAIEEGEAAKKALVEAEKARQEAQAHLLETIDSLDVTREDQDVLSQLMRSVMTGQETTEGKLIHVQNLSERILKNQGNLFEGMIILGEIKELLQGIGMDMKETQDFASRFVDWFREIHEEDINRLENLICQSSQLLAETRSINDKIDRLNQTTDETQKKLDEFHNQWKKSQLEELQKLFHQAENDQYDKAYDKAYEKYEHIVVKGGGDAEVAWRMLLCHYCVSYQPDDDGELIPIIMNPDLADPDEMSQRNEFNRMLKDRTYVDEKQEDVYRKELEKIDSILDQYRNLSSKHDYDVFICVKQETDGHYTKDSNVASDLYDFLTERGLRVFNSRRTPIPAGKEYEPYIIAALCSAKALIVVGTSADHMNAEWVRNEWTRYQWLQKSEIKKTGKTDRVLMCYIVGTMEFSDIPKALNRRIQAVRAGINAQTQLLTALEFLMPQNEKEVDQEEDLQSARQIIAQMTTWLYLKKFDKVLEKYESLTEKGLYLEEVQIHLSALCAEKKVSNITGIINSEIDLRQEPLYQLALSISEGSDEYVALKKNLEKNAAWRDIHVNRSFEEAEQNGNIGVEVAVSDSFDRKIIDSWEEIIENINNKTYRDKYVIGDSKELDPGSEGVIDMQLVAFDEDELADGSGRAPTTWIARQLLKTRKRMKPPSEYQSLLSLKHKEGTGACGGWDKSELRSFLQNDIKTLMPQILKNRILVVKKYSDGLDETGHKKVIITTCDDLWIPSYYEMCGLREGSLENGACYHNVTNKIKLRGDYWLRTAEGYNAFRIIDFSGKAEGLFGFSVVKNLNGICIGFCL